MRFINTYVHGWFDYIVGVVLVVAPFLLGFAAGGPETWVTILLGVILIGYSLFTDYELGALKRIPMNVHLWLDGILGVVLLISPWLFGFAAVVWGPHVVLGIVAILVALLTEIHPGYERRPVAEPRV